MGIALHILLSAVDGGLRCHGDAERVIAGIACDSRRIARGELFVAIPGTREDGHAHVEAAVAAGAGAVLVQADRAAAFVERLPARGVPVVVAASARGAASRLAAAFYEHPSRRLQVVGVTGTNGKTTTTCVIQALLEAAGRPTGSIGTIGCRIGEARAPSANTTPGPVELHRVLAQMWQAGLSHVAMEVSSHALDQGRVDDVAFRVAVFTNLTQEHLDYHGSLERYFAAKARLFDLLDRARGCAVINVDDPWGRCLRATRAGRALTFGVEQSADYTAEAIACDLQGTACRLATPVGRLAVRFPLIGRHNVANVLAAVAVAVECGVPLGQIGEALAAFPGVPGRLERVPVPTPYRVFVDYAHTPDGLRNVLSAMRSLPHRRLIVVFGCGGDRDRQKRPMMGAVATALADLVILTTDNPRSESPEAILRDIQTGMGEPHPSSCRTIVDRAEAIRRALAMAQPNDVVVIAGKGHEQYQIYRDVTVPFDDRLVVQEACGCSPSLISS